MLEKFGVSQTTNRRSTIVLQNHVILQVKLKCLNSPLLLGPVVPKSYLMTRVSRGMDKCFRCLPLKMGFRG